MGNTFMRILFSLLIAITLIPSSYAAEKHFYGIKEKVRLLPTDITVKAKFDTGADTASLDATQIEVYQKEDKTDWVRFKVPLRKGDSIKLVPFDMPVKRLILIKARQAERHHAGGKRAFERPVINMEVCLGDVSKTIEVNLANRSAFKTQMLFGRRTIMAFDGIVDPSQEFTTKLSCPKHD